MGGGHESHISDTERCRGADTIGGRQESHIFDAEWCKVAGPWEEGRKSYIPDKKGTWEQIP